MSGGDLKLTVRPTDRLQMLRSLRFHELSGCSVFLWSPGEIRPPAREWGWTLRCMRHQVEIGVPRFRTAKLVQAFWPVVCLPCWEHFRQAGLMQMEAGREDLVAAARSEMFFPDPQPVASAAELLDWLKTPAKIAAKWTKGFPILYQTEPGWIFDHKARAFREPAPGEGGDSVSQTTPPGAT